MSEEPTAQEIIDLIRPRVPDSAVTLNGVSRRILIRHIDALQAVVDKIPHSADNVPAVPGKKLYPLHPIPGVSHDHGVVTIGIYDPATMTHHVHGYDGFRVGSNYSTPEQAEAARGATRSAS